MKFRNKPLVVEAIQFEYSPSGIEKVKAFCGDALGEVNKLRHPAAIGEAEIRTLEDGIHLTVKHIATEGDWIVKGVQGEFYPVKPGIFAESYDAVKEGK